MKVVVYNILRGGQFECGNRLGKIIEFLQGQNADIYGLLECDHFEKEEQKIASIFEKELDRKIILSKTPSGSCMALLYSKNMILERALTFNRYLYHGLTAADFIWNQQPFRVVLTHLNPYSSELRLIESQILVSIAMRNKNSLILGDFNCPHPDANTDLSGFKSTLIARVSNEKREIDYRCIEHMQNQGYTDIYLKLHPDRKEGTYPTSLGEKNRFYPHPLRIDYIFGTELFVSSCKQCEILIGEEMEKNSDHFPVTGEFDL